MIGLFDSGVGGLFVLRELRRLLPDADLCYYADEAHLPYGGREPAELLRLSSRAVTLLRAAGAEVIVAACGTVSSTVLTRLSSDCPLPVFGAALPLADAAIAHCAQIPHPQILLLATAATVRAGKIEGRIRAARADATVTALAMPELVPLAEGLSVTTEKETAAALDACLSRVPRRAYDALLLGCTHFSALAPMLAPQFPTAALLDGATLAARAAAKAIPAKKRGGSGRIRLFTSGNALAFSRSSRRILGEEHPVFGVE